MSASKRRKTRKKSIGAREKPPKKKRISKHSRVSRTPRKHKQFSKHRKRASPGRKLAKKKKSTTKKPVKSTRKQRKKVPKTTPKKIVTKAGAPRKKRKAAKKRKVAVAPKKRKPAKQPVKKKKVAAKKRKPAKKPTKKPAKKPTKKSVKKKRKPTYKPVTRDVLQPISEKLRPIVRERAVRPTGELEKLGPNIYYIHARDFGTYREDEKPGEDITRFMVSTKGMRPEYDKFAEVFHDAFYDFMRRTPFEDPNDIPIFRFGIAITTHARRTMSGNRIIVNQMASMLKSLMPAGTSAHIVDEDNYVTVRLNFGNYRKPAAYGDAVEYMRNNKELLYHFVQGARDIAEDIFWFEFWDTEEVYY